MITIFRKIREKLLGENKFSQYVIYALGEIVLVIIGILIALQINNWNKNRKSKLQEIRSSLLSDIKQLNEPIELAEKDASSSQYIYSII